MTSGFWSAGRSLARLDPPPLLASWNRSTDPAQQRVQRYLDEVQRAVEPAIAGHPGVPLYLYVHAALPQHRDLLVHHDLENYLTPLAHRLRHHPLVLARGHVDLGLHLRSDPSMAWDVGIDVRWRSA